LVDKRGKYKRTKKTKDKLSQDRKDNWEDPEYRATLEKERKERWDDKEWAKAQKKRLNDSQTPEVCKKISEGQKKSFEDPERLRKHQEMVQKTAEVRSQKMKKNWNDPKFIYKIFSAKCNHEIALNIIENRLGKEVRDKFEKEL